MQFQEHCSTEKDLQEVNQADWLEGIASEPSEVQTYLRQYRIEDDLKTTVGLVRKHFPAGTNSRVTIQGDGESDELWLVVDIIVNDPSEEVFGHFDRFVNVWIVSVSLTSKSRIRLTYSAR